MLTKCNWAPNKVLLTVNGLKKQTVTIARHTDAWTRIPKIEYIVTFTVDTRGAIQTLNFRAISLDR